MSASVAFYYLFNTLATTGVGDVEPRHPIVLLALFAYVLVGLAVVSLFINLLHAKFSRAYWLPDPMMLPSVDKENNARSPVSNVASFDSDLSMSDANLNHYVTLGVLQAEDRRPLLAALLKERGYRHASVQTTVTLPNQRSLQVVQKDGGFDTTAVYLAQPTTHTSNDDVHKLMTETYTGRPPRLI
uniref:Potassium channel domain-containing protein n=1 Tax=Plectus sambesii TaxID=2011161 RepID=A0A914WND0_9BILA